jgi:hypothetical protein
MQEDEDLDQETAIARYEEMSTKEIHDILSAKGLESGNIHIYHISKYALREAITGKLGRKQVPRLDEVELMESLQLGSMTDQDSADN